MGLFFGSSKRNDPLRVGDPHPVPRYADAVHTGNELLDGYTLLSRANPDYMGSPPYIGARRTFRSADDSFEQ